MQRKDPTEAIAAACGNAITITTEQCIKAWREAVPGAPEDPTHIDIVGAMGSASSIGLGIALAKPERKVLVLDGDGSLLMQLGSLVTIAGAAPKNFYHFVFENGVYATSGGQPLPGADRLDFETMARAAGFALSARYDDAAKFKEDLPGLLDREGPVFVTLQIEPEAGIPSGARSAVMGEQLMAVREVLSKSEA
jgi:phosphonopyruvate decarboxylase